MSLLSETEIKLFNQIVNFVGSLNDLYGETDESIALYNILLEKTGLVHKEPVRKHITLFTTFLTENEEVILNKEVGDLKNTVLEYSPKVYLDLKLIFQQSDEENTAILWQHLLALLAIVNPLSGAKDMILSQNSEPQVESNFISNIVKKVTDNIDENNSKDPAEMVNSILGSGIFTDLVQDMNNGIASGELDLSKMMGGLQSIMGDLSKNLEKKY